MSYDPTCFRLACGMIGFTIETSTAFEAVAESTMYSTATTYTVYDRTTVVVNPDSPLYSAVAVLYKARNGDIRGRNTPPDGLQSWEDSDHDWDWDTCSQPYYDLDASTPSLSVYQAERNLSDLIASL